MTPDRRILLALFAIAFGLRILYAAVAGTNPAINPSPATYDYHLAERMHDNLRWLDEPFTSQAPAYPVLLAATFRVFGVRQWVAILMQSFLGAVTALMLYRIGERRLGRGVGLLSAIWLGLSVHQVHFASIFVRDTLTTFALTWFVYTVVRRFERMRQAIWAGVVYTFLIHVDPRFLLFLPVVLVYFALAATRHRILNVQYLFLFLATVVAVSLPWTIRNAVVYGEAIPIGLEANRYVRPFARLIAPGDESKGGLAALDDRRVQIAHPGGVVQNSIEFWRVTHFGAGRLGSSDARHTEPAWSLRHNLVNIATFGVLLPFALAGVALAWRRRRRAGLVIAGVIVMQWLVYALLGATERSRLPIEPLVILLAFYGLTGVVGAIRSGRNADAVQPAPAA